MRERERVPGGLKVESKNKVGKEREIALQGEKDKEREAGIVGLLPNSGGKESERESFNQAIEKSVL